MTTSKNSKAKREPIDKTALVGHLRNQLNIIRDYCKLYDSGRSVYAQEIAVKLRILFHHEGRNKSLLRQLRLEHVSFVDTGTKYDPYNIVPHHGLVVLSSTIGVRTEWEPKVDKDKGVASFENWWDGKKIIVIPQKAVFTRRRLILELAETDGGAHVDAGIDSEYHELRNKNSLGWFYGPNNTPMPNPVPASVRQIAHEVLSTFENIDIVQESKLH